MVGIYFSGTGNTKHCIEKMVNEWSTDTEEKAQCYSIESEQSVKAIMQNEIIILGYPIQYSNTPVIMREFIKEHANIWNGKKVVCVATQGMFSGDGAGCGARLLKKYGANIIGGIHLKMPNSISDCNNIKHSDEEKRSIITKTDQKIERIVKQIKYGNYPKEGLNIFCHIVGLLGQRLWYYNKTLYYSDKVKVNKNCTGCGLCAEICPNKNMKIINGRSVPGKKCAMCYRCINQCPQKAITLLGNRR